MKKILVFSIIAITAIFVSCQKSPELTKDAGQNSSETLLVGKSVNQNSDVVFGPATICAFWKINSFIVDGKDIASDFDLYKFEFCSNNLITAIHPKFSIFGKWIIYPGLSMDSRDLLSIGFTASLSPSSTGVEYLNGRWFVQSISDFSMHLVYASGKVLREVKFERTK